MKGKLYLLSALLLLYLPIFAQQVSLETAQRVASMFLQNNVPAAMRSASATNTATSSASVIKPIGKVAQSPVMYAVSQDNVWVLVSADERVTPILAYSDANAGIFPEEEDMPDGMAALLDWYEYQIQYLRDSTNITSIHEEWLTYRMTSRMTTVEPIVPPLLSKNGEENKWKQSSNNSGTGNIDRSYNKFCPLNQYGRPTVVGCVAVAIGQVMWYWEWPIIAVVIKDKYKDTFIREYIWDYMPARLTNSTPIEHVDMVANLLHDVGESVSMRYGTDESGASNKSVPNVLKYYFKYHADDLLYRGSNNPNWLDMLKENLQKSYPILYAGYDPDKEVGGAHQFVVDGYDSSNAFHINYGWGDDRNGYYMLDTIAGVPYQFYQSQNAILNIHPNYPSCHHRELSQNDILDTIFAIQNGGGITMGNMIVENGQEGGVCAGDFVKLTSGFHAKAGSELRIITRNVLCSDSVAISAISSKIEDSITWCDQWNVLSHGYLGPDEPLYNAHTIIHSLKGDTIINDLVYQKLVGHLAISPPTPNVYIGALRFAEDKKVFVYYDNNEYLLYDFNVQIGDTLNIFGGIEYYIDNKTLPHIVVNIDTLDDGRIKIISDAIIQEEINGIIHEEKRQKIWIEGIGSLDGIVYNTATTMYGSGKKVLLCAYHNNDCCYTTDYTSYASLGCVYNDSFFTATEEVNSYAPSAQKIISNGQLLIIHDGKTYNVTGVEVGQ